MANRYVIIDEGANGLTKRFKSIQMSPKVTVSKQVDRTIGGDLDVTYGGVYEAFRYVLRVPWYSADTQYGTYAELVQMFRRNNPAADALTEPLTTFTFTDHYGNTHNNAFFGNETLEIEPLTTVLDTQGNESSYIIQVEILLAKDDKVVPSPS